MRYLVVMGMLCLGCTEPEAVTPTVEPMGSVAGEIE